jgi:chemosensory pili system protein ChpA (sensor histidine kinase/response regulator)
MIQGPSKILVADDSVTIRRVIRMKLADRVGVQVIEAENGLDAIAKANELKPDLILLDLAMPELNGAEAAVTLKKVLPSVPIILFTIYADDIGPSLASAVGVDMVLSKPEGLESLMNNLTPILDALAKSAAFMA